ncbi:hypothetical protein DTL42_16225 [Bremerella cremea]|uniref:DUF423 domain-containing protein n=1 Tax=Bremerella cremea TaxID=1031537 RepID=A0A368KNK2_9BACT|nr:DUF423 domain-containing protein [Bremerella cremea]RCS46034.1 hypothetical protein DTL42_16225 [Bremerella cremea]
MSTLNLIFGCLFGLGAVLAGPVGESFVQAKFQTELREKAKLTPGRINPDGSQEKDSMEISTIDRQESDQRWARYQKGIQSISIYSLALVGLGLLSTSGKGQLIGGIGFGLGTLLYGGGLALGAYFNMPTIGVLAPIGAMILLAGWGGLLLAALQGRGEKPMLTEAGQ